MSGSHGSAVPLLTAAALVLVGVAGSGYLAGVVGHRWRGRWPAVRTVSWLLGLAAAAVGLLVGHRSFPAHMVGHVLLGMLAPLLLVGGAPLTLALRTLPARQARRLGRVLRARPVALLTCPLVAALLSVGGLWLLYRTGLHEASTHRPLLALAVQAHVLVAGYLFTAALVGVDPVRHRWPLGARAAVLVTAVAAHNVLAKAVVADPPAAVSGADALLGGQIMYYLGAPVEIALFVLLGRRWAVQDRRARAAAIQ